MIQLSDVTVSDLIKDHLYMALEGEKVKCVSYCNIKSVRIPQ